jgi:chromate reductase
MTKPFLLGISGSLRKDATNTRLLRVAASHFGPCDFELANLRLPLFDADEEDASGIPPEVQTLADQIARADAVAISTPEYNKGPSGVLKNALDWVSRTEGKPWNGKPVAVMSAAAGRAGGERAQMILRSFMVPFQPRILQGPEMHLADSRNQFDGTGALTNARSDDGLKALMQALRKLV